jgi:hypothetical protein
VALAAVKGDRTIAQLAVHFDVHPQSAALSVLADPGEWQRGLLQLNIPPEAG